MKNNKKGITTTIIITICVLIYLGIYFGLFISAVDNLAVKILLAIIPVILGIAMIKVCLERVKEIKGGDKDDLGKY